MCVGCESGFTDSRHADLFALRLHRTLRLTQSCCCASVANMFQLIRDFMVLKELPVWPGDGWEKGTSNGSWENQASGFQDYTLAPAIPDGYMLTPTCACKPECSPRARVCVVYRVMTACRTTAVFCCRGLVLPPTHSCCGRRGRVGHLFRMVRTAACAW